MEKEFLNKTIFRKFKIVSLIGKGSYSLVFSARNLVDKNMVAIKIQDKHQIFGNLEKEAYYLYTLKVAKVLLGKNDYNVDELYDVINNMINYKELNNNEGNTLSQEFFDEIYIPLISNIGEVSGYPKDVIEFNNNKPIITGAQKVLKKYYKNK